LKVRTPARKSRKRASFANVRLPAGPATKKLGAYTAARAWSSSPIDNAAYCAKNCSVVTSRS
jgi:hypothetical protein